MDDLTSFRRLNRQRYLLARDLVPPTSPTPSEKSQPLSSNIKPLFRRSLSTLTVPGVSVELDKEQISLGVNANSHSNNNTTSPPPPTSKSQRDVGVAPQTLKYLYSAFNRAKKASSSIITQTISSCFSVSRQAFVYALGLPKDFSFQD
eukprot:Awhi_evm1s14487